MECKQNGWAVRDFRVKTGLTRTELAERARMHPSHIANIELENKDPSKEALNRIAVVLSVDIRSILRNPEAVVSSRRNGKAKGDAA